MQDSDPGIEEIETRLTELELKARDSMEESGPNNVLEILNLDTDEVSWTGLFAYFLDPGEPHQLESAVLENFIGVLDAEGQGPKPVKRIDFDKAQVLTEAPVHGGKVDIFIYGDRDWFVMIEAKVHHDERPKQTRDYANATQVDNRIDLTSFPESNRCYVFLAPENQSPESDDFQQLSWLEVRDMLDDVRATATDAPLKTIAQITEFRDIITETMENTDIDHSQEAELAQLYNQYSEVIERVHEAPERLARAIYEAYPTAIRSDQYRPETFAEDGSDNWVVEFSGSDNPHLYREGWKQGDELNIHFELEPTPENSSLRMRDVIVDQEFTIELHCHNWRDARPQFKNHFYEEFSGGRTAEGVEIQPERSGKQETYIKTSYSFNVGDEEYGYFPTLAGAIDAHATVATTLDEIVERARREYSE